jgi:class 3 adenylate cyclase
MEVGRVRYATSRDGTAIAWTQFGEGPVDALFLTGFVGHLEVGLEHPLAERFFSRLASGLRVTIFDKRGQGLSDRPACPATMEQHAEDALAVLDAAGIERAALIGVSEGGPAAMVLAAAHPERISQLALYGTFARILRDDDYPCGYPSDEVAALRDGAPEHWGDPVALHRFAPTLARDPSFQEYWSRLLRAGTSPQGIYRMIATWPELDVRAVLPTLAVPTLVLVRRDDVMTPPAMSEYLVREVRDARLVVLDGCDHLFLAGDQDALLSEIRSFLVGAAALPIPEQVLATVVFTDIVGSTEQAARLGDRDWRALLERHDELVRTHLRRFQGREVKHLGDGFLAAFDGPARAIRCAQAIAAEVQPLGIEIRAGIHAGECERRGDDLSGMAVHIGARVGAAAAPSEILVSGTVRDLVVGSGIAFEDRGEAELKGVPGTWRLHAVAEAVSSTA